MTEERLTRITIDDAQCGGRPCIRGMRIRVTDILELLSSGASIEEILQDYPGIRREERSRVHRVCRSSNGSRRPPVRVKFLVDNQFPPPTL